MGIKKKLCRPHCWIFHIIKFLVRPRIEYGNAVWSPYRLGYFEDIEKVQMRHTKLVKLLKYLSYESRLKALDLPTLKYRRHRGEMIEVFKFLRGLGLCDNSVSEKLFKLSNIDYTLGDSLKLTKKKHALWYT